ncbi:hypothetical protein QE152_g39224 [Popillia japonica]|uniref:Uncharacterized protein n=1 Tax=Popillia japonica TaxID=7064 RepID=A0AAW1HUP1_POPJA
MLYAIPVWHPVQAPAPRPIRSSATDAELQGSSAGIARDAQRVQYQSAFATLSRSPLNDPPWKLPFTECEAPPTSTAEPKPPSPARNSIGY